MKFITISIILVCFLDVVLCDEGHVKDTEKCCSSNSDNGETECCPECCDQDKCAPYCQSQFDALPCQLEQFPTSEDNNIAAGNWRTTCIDYEEGVALYRLLRDDESCNDGLVATNPLKLDVTVYQHVRCGKYGNSPYISTCSTLDKDSFQGIYLKKARQYNPPKALARIDTKKFKPGCKVYASLTNPADRQYWLGDDKDANRWAEQACEVLIYCDPGVRVECEEIPYMYMDNQDRDEL